MIRIISGVLVLLLTACQPTPRPQVPAGPMVLPELVTAGAARYRIDPASSFIHLKVYRDGPLAKLGHNHVIAALNLQGMVYRQRKLADSSFELIIPVASMAVDRPAEIGRVRGSSRRRRAAPSPALPGARPRRRARGGARPAPAAARRPVERGAGRPTARDDLVRSLAHELEPGDRREHVAVGPLGPRPPGRSRTRPLAQRQPETVQRLDERPQVLRAEREPLSS